VSKAAEHDARPDFDVVIQDIVDYVLDYDVTRSRLLELCATRPALSRLLLMT